LNLRILLKELSVIYLKCFQYYMCSIDNRSTPTRPRVRENLIEKLDKSPEDEGDLEERFAAPRRAGDGSSTRKRKGNLTDEPFFFRNVLEI
jgi:hypothetical protein